MKLKKGRVMFNLQPIARLLIITGVLLIFAGLFLLLFSRFGFLRLPGDILIQRRNLTIYIPVVSAIVLSLILTLILNLIFWRWR
ncbi:MAG: DUF2905 domain-containing protein [candidate division WOR-3 bacterium]